MKLLCRKTFSRLEPVDDTGRDDLRKIKNGAIVKVEIVRPRNPNHHRMYWALINLVWQNIGHETYPTAETLHQAIKVLTGHRTELVLKDSTVVYMPKSTSFEAMDQAAFSEYYDRVADLLAEKFLPGVTNQQLKEEVASMIGIAA